MIPYTKNDHVTTNTPGSDNIIVRFNGEIRRFVQEAKAGDPGFIVQVKHDGQKLYIRDDAMGSIVVERLEGKVELFELEEGDDHPLRKEMFFFNETIIVPVEKGSDNAPAPAV